MDDFGVEYVGEEHSFHLASILKRYHKISEDWVGKRILGINMEWIFAKAHKERTCRLLVKGYIADLILRLGHTKPVKPHLSLHKSKDRKYSSSGQLSPEEDTSSQFDKDGITRVQMVGCALL
jgi:hypothetical protein